MINVIDLLDLFVMTEVIVIWDGNSETEVFRGDMDDIPIELEYETVQSIDWPNSKELVINVDLDE